MSTEAPIARLRDVHKAFGPLQVLQGIDLDVRPGKNLVILGPSGSGKSVLLKHLIGLLRPDRGRVFFHDEEISAMREKDLTRVRRQMGFLFQNGALFDSMTVEENLCFPMAQHGEGTAAERKERAREVLVMVGLDGLQTRLPEELSGGQRKRVALARAIVLKPELILYDEPTTGLDPVRSDLINELILRLRERLGAAAVVVTHDLASARKVADRILMLHQGRFIADTTPDRMHEVDNEVFVRFVEGRASREELAEIETGHLRTPEEA